MTDTIASVGSATVGKPGFARWAVLAQSVATEDRRISAQRTANLPATGLGASAHLIRTENSDQRIIDMRSHRVVIGPSAEGEVVVIDTEVEGVTVVARLQGVPVEAGAFDSVAGLLYTVDSGGSGAVIELQHDGSLRVLARFSLPRVQGPLDASTTGGFLYLLCERRNRLLVFDLSDPLLPVLDTDTTYDTGLYWERNPVRSIQSLDNSAVRKFGSVPWLADHGDLPVSHAAAAWALHGEIAAITYTDDPPT